MKLSFFRQTAQKLTEKILPLISAYLLFIPSFTPAQPPPSLSDSLIVLPVAISSGQTTVAIQISLANSVPIAGISGRMVFDSNIITPQLTDSSGGVSIEKVGRGTVLSSFAANTHESGAVTFLLVTGFPTLDTISAGSGPVCRINFNVLTSNDTTICIRLEDNPADPFDIKNELADDQGALIIPSLKPGSLTIGAGSPFGACPEVLDEIGDLNLNGVRYELADFVLFENFFVYGNAVFFDPIHQARNSDVNRDGLTLRVSDLVSLGRIIVSDSNPLPRPNLASSADTVSFQVSQTSDHLLISSSSSTDIGGYFLDLLFSGAAGEPIRLDTVQNMDFGSQIYPSELRFLLVSSISNQPEPGGKIPAGTGPLLSIPFSGAILGLQFQASTPEGQEMTVLTSITPPLRGDLNADFLLSSADVVLELNCIFLPGGNCPLNLADANCDGSLTAADAVVLMNTIFLGIPLPCL